MIKNRIFYYKDTKWDYTKIDLLKASNNTKIIYVDFEKIYRFGEFVNQIYLKVLGKELINIENIGYDDGRDYLMDLPISYPLDNDIYVCIKNFSSSRLDNDIFLDIMRDVCFYSENNNYYSGVKTPNKSIDFFIFEKNLNFEDIPFNNERILDEIFDIKEETINYKIYPVGTVVRLKDDGTNDKLSEYSYMITNRFVLKDESSKVYYEYKANIYPIGCLPNGKGIMFNNEDIRIVEFVGYETVMDRKFVEDVKKKLEEKNIRKIKTDNKQ